MVISGDGGSGCSASRFKQFTTTAFSVPAAGQRQAESGRNYAKGVSITTDLAIPRLFKFGRPDS